MTDREKCVLYLSDIVAYAKDAMSFVEGLSKEEFIGDKRTYFAVIRTIEVVGEAVKSIPESIRVLAPEVTWSSFAGMRDVLIHKYFGVDAGIVWQTVIVDFPPLILSAESLLRLLEEHDH